MKTSPSSLSLAYLTVERNPPPYYFVEKRIRENLSPEIANLRERLSSIKLITSWKMNGDINKQVPDEHFGIRLIGPLQKAIITPVKTRIIYPVRKLFTEFSVNNYLLLFTIAFISVGVLVICSTL